VKFLHGRDEADPDKSDKQGQSPLLLAVRKGTRE